MKDPETHKTSIYGQLGKPFLTCYFDYKKMNMQMTKNVETSPAPIEEVK